MAKVRIFSGTDRHDDPWHPFAETSSVIAETLAEAGFEAEVTESEPVAIGDLAGVDLLVVNAGGGPDPRNPLRCEPAWDDAYARLDVWLAAHPMLVVHSGINAFRDWPRWSDLAGATWVPGVSGHPEASLAVFEPVAGAEQHPILDGLSKVEAFDERYQKLDVRESVTPVLQHETGDTYWPVVWVTGTGNVVYDALGHDARAYSPTRRRLLVNEVAWLLR